MSEENKRESKTKRSDYEYSPSEEEQYEIPKEKNEEKQPEFEYPPFDEEYYTVLAKKERERSRERRERSYKKSWLSSVGNFFVSIVDFFISLMEEIPILSLLALPLVIFIPHMLVIVCLIWGLILVPIDISCNRHLAYKLYIDDCKQIARKKEEPI